MSVTSDSARSPCPTKERPHPAATWTCRPTSSAHHSFPTRRDVADCRPHLPAPGSQSAHSGSVVTVAPVAGGVSPAEDGASTTTSFSPLSFLTSLSFCRLFRASSLAVFSEYSL